MMKKLAVITLALMAFGCIGSKSDNRQKPVVEAKYTITCARDWTDGRLTNRELTGFDVLGVDGQAPIYRIDTVDGVRAWVPATDCYITKINKD